VVYIGRHFQYSLMAASQKDLMVLDGRPSHMKRGFVTPSRLPKVRSATKTLATRWIIVQSGHSVGQENVNFLILCLGTGHGSKP
jgi:hypothetical protein